MREIVLDGSPEPVLELTEALHAALNDGETVLPLAGTDPSCAALRAAMAPEDPVEPETAVLIATSGSTGEPKGVLLSATALRASATATHERLGGDGHWLLATPACYIGGVQVLVRALLADTEPGIVETRGGFVPEAFTAAAAGVLNEPGRHYTALVPTQLAKLLEDGAACEALRGFDAIVLGGAATSPSLRARAVDAGVRVVAAYGMSETASGCVYDGIPLDGVGVRLAGESDGIGVIEVSGSVLAHGYRRAPEHTAESFVDGWFRTGDLGRFDGERLEVLGRADDMINSGGVKLAPALIERVLLAQPSVAQACVVGMPDEHWGEAVVAAIVPASGVGGPDEAKLAAAVRAELGKAAVPKRFERLPTFPMRGPGKVDRGAVREAMGES
ncbi:o-succinylbenzoate--CoA ligase [Sciscionella sediminilitoris]|uniref:o-succinylbenzoate--CoA ligase n=1 Tax=Sciscionella sediminilitoris TaxID=1445613 RepID=UPI0004DED46A|nr:o-succinylbenzoate--CoA ligase [Sciscionella sp. SE31]